MNEKVYKKILLGLVLCISAFIGLGCDSGLNSQDVLTKAEKMIGNGKYEAATEILRPYIYKNQESFKAHLLAGKALLNLNISDEKNLYLSRHYFKNASEFAANETQRLEADQAYADVRLMMGKTGKSAETLFEAAIRADTIGNSGQAIKLYIQAANLFIIDDNLSDAIESCKKGINSNPDIGDEIALRLTLARALFLNEDYQESSNDCATIKSADAKMIPAHRDEIAFLKVASGVMLMERKRKLLSFNPLKKEFENGSEQVFIDEFNKSLNCLKNLETSNKKGQEKLIGQYSLILARHAKDNEMQALANQAYEYSRTVFRRAGLEEEALEVGEELAKLDD